MYACLCARAAWCRTTIFRGRRQPFTARLGPKTWLGTKVSWLVLVQKVQSKYRCGWWYQYCTVEILTEMKFTSTFQNYLQCVNHRWFSDIRSVCLSRTSSDSAVPVPVHVQALMNTTCMNSYVHVDLLDLVPVPSFKVLPVPYDWRLVYYLFSPSATDWRIKPLLSGNPVRLAD